MAPYLETIEVHELTDSPHNRSKRKVLKPLRSPRALPATQTSATERPGIVFQFASPTDASTDQSVPQCHILHFPRTHTVQDLGSPEGPTSPYSNKQQQQQQQTPPPVSVTNLTTPIFATPITKGGPGRKPSSAKSTSISTAAAPSGALDMGDLAATIPQPTSRGYVKGRRGRIPGVKLAKKGMNLAAPYQPSSTIWIPTLTTPHVPSFPPYPGQQLQQAPKLPLVAEAAAVALENLSQQQFNSSFAGVRGWTDYSPLTSPPSLYGFNSSTTTDDASFSPPSFSLSELSEEQAFDSSSSRASSSRGLSTYVEAPEEEEEEEEYEDQYRRRRQQYQSQSQETTMEDMTQDDGEEEEEYEFGDFMEEEDEGVAVVPQQPSSPPSIFGVPSPSDEAAAAAATVASFRSSSPHKPREPKEFRAIKDLGGKKSFQLRELLHKQRGLRDHAQTTHRHRTASSSGRTKQPSADRAPTDAPASYSKHYIRVMDSIPKHQPATERERIERIRAIERAQRVEKAQLKPERVCHIEGEKGGKQSSWGGKKECLSCGTKKTPYWRDGWDGVVSILCNACGIRFQKYRLRCNNCLYIPRKDEKHLTNCVRCGAKMSTIPLSVSH